MDLIYRGMQGITGEYNGLQGNTRDYIGLIIIIKNKYKTYIAHIQYKFFHMRITDDKNKINKSIKSYMYK